MIRTSQLTKRFGRVLAVDNLDMDVRPGDIYGFVGANGSGKTTTVRMLLGLVLPTSGRVELFDQLMPRMAARVLPRSVGSLRVPRHTVTCPVGPTSRSSTRADTGRNPS